MKKVLFAAFAAASLLGCSADVKEVERNSDSLVVLNVSLTPVMSKSALSDDMSVSDVQVFVFDDSGALEAYDQGNADAMNSSLRCVPGMKTVVAVVNGPYLGDIEDYDSLRQYESDLLEDNSPGKFLMTGECTYEVGRRSPQQNVQVAVSHRVAKILLNRLTVHFDVSHNAEKGFVLRRAYLVNVAGTTRCLHHEESQTWYNQASLESPGDGPLLCYAPFGQQDVGSGMSISDCCSFYAYPNESGDASGLPWTPRKTRLVVEAMIGDELCYYPVTIPSVSAGHLYKVNLVVRHKGSGSPDEPVDVLDVMSSVTVEDWTIASEIYEEI